MEATDPKVPLARQEGLLVHELPDEVLVYDLERHRAHSLNQMAAFVWRHCDGQASVPDLSALLHQKMGMATDDELVWLVLDRLSSAHLLQAKLSLPACVPSHSRREMLRTAAMAGGLALVSSVVAPKAEAAAGSTCTTASQCPGFCCCVCTTGSNRNKGCQASLSVCNGLCPGGNGSCAA